MLEKNISISEVARLLGLNRDTVSRKLSGKGIFNLDEIEKIQQGLFPEMTIEELFRKTN